MRPTPLTDNRSSYIAIDMAGRLDQPDTQNTDGASYHPTTQGKIERQHQTLEKHIPQETLYLPSNFEVQTESFPKLYNHQRQTA